MIRHELNICKIRSSIAAHAEDDVLSILGREDLLQVLANNQNDLHTKSKAEQDRKSELHRENLSIGLHESDARIPVKSLPRIKHADDTVAANDLGVDLSAEAAVEGNDGLELVWEERSLDTDQNDGGGDDDQKCESETERKDKENLEDHDPSLAVSGVDEIIRLADEVEGSSEVHWEGDGCLLGDGQDGGWAGNLLPHLDGGDAAVPWLWVGVGDHDVCPAQIQMCADDGGDYGSEEEGNKQVEYA